MVPSSYLFVMSLAVRSRHVLPLHMAFGFLQLLLNVVLYMVDLGVDVILNLVDMGEEPHTGGEQKTHHIDKLHGWMRMGCSWQPELYIIL